MNILGFFQRLGQGVAAPHRRVAGGSVTSAIRPTRFAEYAVYRASGRGLIFSITRRAGAIGVASSCLKIARARQRWREPWATSS